MLKKLKKEVVVFEYLLRGIEDLFFAFKIDELFSRHKPYFYAMGFEMICKAYLLAKESNKYETLSRTKATKKIDELCKGWGHKLKDMIKEIKKIIKTQDFKNLFKKDYNGFCGSQLVKVMQSAYFECRYPVPKPIFRKFKVPNYPRTYWEPLYSTGMDKFCYAFTHQILMYLKKDFKICFSKRDFSKVNQDDAGERFWNLFSLNAPGEIKLEFNIH